jgi:hypothetical protein
MLLDTGADTTLIPEQAAVALGLSAEAGAQWELRGVEGASILAREVFLELRFLRRTFRGQSMGTKKGFVDLPHVSRQPVKTQRIAYIGLSLGWVSPDRG